MVHGLSCSVACGIFLDQGSNPCPLHWQTDSQPLRHQGSPGRLFMKDKNEAQGLFSFSKSIVGDVSLLSPLLVPAGCFLPSSSHFTHHYHHQNDKFERSHKGKEVRESAFHVEIRKEL